MNLIFQKLQFKNQEKILILNSPDEFKLPLQEISLMTRVGQSISDEAKYDFALIFIKMCSEIAPSIQKLLPCLNSDAIIWFAYPKKTSKKYQSDISRDQGWQPLGDAGFEAVRQIAIDEDWSALRFRRVEFIKTLKRDIKMTMSSEGKNVSRNNLC